MKKTLVALMLGLVSILFVGCGNSTKTTDNNVKVEITEKKDSQWEYVGKIKAYSVYRPSYSTTYQKTYIHNGVEVWVKQMGSEIIYQVRRGQDKYLVTPNPYYGKVEDDRGRARYQFDSYYIEL